MSKYINSVSKPLIWSLATLLVAVAAGCGGGSSGSAGVGSAASGPVGTACTGASCVNLGTAANYVILAKTGASTIPASVVTGNIGLSPAARGFLTGWSLVAEPTDTAYTSTQVIGGGHLYAADMVGGTTSVDLTTAVSDMQTAYTAAAGMAPAGGGLITPCPGAGTMAGITIAPGVYTCSVPVGITGSITLNGSATDVWVFQFAQTLTQSAATQVTLTGGALAQNVFWQVAGNVDIGTTAVMQGVILGQTLINLQTGATANGRLLGQTAVTIDQATVTVP